MYDEKSTTDNRTQMHANLSHLSITHQQNIVDGVVQTLLASLSGTAQFCLQGLQKITQESAESKMSCWSSSTPTEVCKRFKSFICSNGNIFSTSNAIRLVGSFAELLPTYHDCDVSEFDFDVMVPHRKIIALPPQYPNTRQRFTVVDIESDNANPGFARLVNRFTGQRLSWDYITNSSCSGQPAVEWIRRCGPSDSMNFSQIENNNWNEIPIVLIADSCDRKAKAMFVTGIDRVPCVRCPVWPDEATEWLTRMRRNGWPTRSLIDQCVQSGCAFVTKARKESDDPETEFRYSFSFAEIVLVRSWLPTQKFIYNTLKQRTKAIGKGLFDKNLLCSYYIKTLMFWACEEKESAFWEETRIWSTVNTLLCELIGRIIDENLPHYFIRRFNLMRDCNDDVQTVVRILHQLVEEVQLRTASSIGELPTEPQLCRISANALFLLHVVCGNPKVIADALKSETIDLYRGIRAQLSLEKHQGMIKPVSRQQQQQQQLSDATTFMSEARGRHDSLIELTLAPGEDMLSAAERVSRRKPACGAHRRQTLSTASVRQQRCAETASTSNQIRDRVQIYDRQQLAFAYRADEFARLESGLMRGLASFFREMYPYICQQRAVALQAVLGWLVPKHCSWHLASAHLANLNYKTLQRYDEAIRICDETLDFIDAHDAYRHVHDSAFSVILSSHWAPIFDCTLQMIYGLVALIDFLRNGRSSSNDAVLIVKLCPIVLVHYIRIRCLHIRGEGERVMRSASERLRKHISTRMHRRYYYCDVDYALLECIAYRHHL